jgi:hypothetical protein
MRWVGGVLLAGFLLLQLANPARTNPPVAPDHDLLATNPPPPEIVAMLKNACYDCHSYETRWLWYSHVAPVSFLIVNHVNDGRDAMNFSEWPHDQPSRARKKLRHIADEVEDREMPIRNYTWLHPDARLTDQQRSNLVQWARQAGNADDN